MTLSNSCRIAGTLLFLLSSGMASGQAANSPVSAPDILLLVYVQPDGKDILDITYPVSVPHAQAQQDLQALAQNTGWTPQGVKITDALPPVQGVTQKMTSVEFRAGRTVNAASGRLPLEPVIEALRSYHRIVLNYSLGMPFEFHGLREFSDPNLKIGLRQTGTTYTYDIHILNPRFARLNLPLDQTLAQAAAVTALPAVNHAPVKPRINPWMAALVALLAVGTGIVVYAALARAT